ncbi:hypothetical protein DFH06DRAFT_124941 [Mycena polygramma]|nr:hypothetical protein DFH06DRAFT_124941 [Mycena polygramma]
MSRLRQNPDGHRFIPTSSGHHDSVTSWRTRHVSRLLLRLLIPISDSTSMPDYQGSTVTKWFILHRTVARSYCLAGLLFAFTVLGPILLQRFSKTSAVARFAQAGARGCTALTLALVLLMLHELINDIDQWLSMPTAERSTLENSVFARPIYPRPTTSETPLGMLTPPTFLGKLFCLPCLTFFVVHQWLVTDTVLFVRIDAAVLNILRGTEIFSAVFLLLLILAWPREGRIGSMGAVGVPSAHKAGKAGLAFSQSRIAKDVETTSAA